MSARRLNVAVIPPPAHPLAHPPRAKAWVVIVLVGWLALLGWSPEESLALVLALLPVSHVATKELG